MKKARRMDCSMALSYLQGTQIYAGTFINISYDEASGGSGLSFEDTLIVLRVLVFSVF